MRKIFFKGVNQLILSLWGIIFIVSSAYAIPSLQLYIPGSTYDPITESWTTTASDFELQVLGASSPLNADYIKNLTLYIAIKEDEKGLPGAYVNLNGSPINFNYYGNPFLMPPHGIYPTYYCAYWLPNLMVSTAGEVVHNYKPGGGGTDLGDIHYLSIKWGGYSHIHFDVAGIVVDKFGKKHYRKAPFSRDAEANSPTPSAVPEPSTILLLLPGLLGLANFRRSI
ncbi:MAG: choice-of-anchor N protein [bacterium]